MPQEPERSPKGSDASGSRPATRERTSRPGSRGQPASRRQDPCTISRPTSQSSSRAGSHPVRPWAAAERDEVRGSVQFVDAFAPDPDLAAVGEVDKELGKSDGEDSSAGSSSQSASDGDNDNDDDNDVVAELPRYWRSRSGGVKDNRTNAIATMLSDMRRYQDESYNGLFIDFCVRHRARKFDHENAKMLLDRTEHIVEDKPHYAGGAETVEAEKLLATLRKIITYFYKSTGVKEWMSTGKEFREHLTKVLNLQRKKVALNVAVDTFMLLRKLKYNARVRVPEYEHERRQRLGSYWTNYHSSHKLTNIAADIVDEAALPEPESPLGRATSSPKTSDKHATKAASAMEFLGGRSLVMERCALDGADLKFYRAPTPKTLSVGERWYAHTTGPRRAETPGSISAAIAGDAWKLRGSRSLCSRGGSRAHPAGLGAGAKDLGGTAMYFPSLTATSTSQSRPATQGTAAAERGRSKVDTDVLPAGRTGRRCALARGIGPLAALPTVPGSNAGDSRPQSTWMGSRASSRAGTAGLQSPLGSSGGFQTPLGSSTGFKDWGFANSLPLEKMRKEHHLGFSNIPSGHSASAPNLSLPSMVTPKVPRVNKRGIHSVHESMKFELPHGDFPAAHSVSLAKSATQSYLRACDGHFVLPSLLPFCTGHSSRLQASGQAMTDDDLLMVSEMFRTLAKVEEVDLENNGGLSDRSLVPLLNKLKMPCADRNLKSLSLKSCMKKTGPVGIQTVAGVLTQLISDHLEHLGTLDLSGVGMGPKTHLELCQAIRLHPRLRNVALADTKLGFDMPNVQQCIDELLRAPCLEELDLGWNPFDEEIFERLGEGVLNMDCLKTLRLANCACNARHGLSSVERFLELLASQSSLTNLDISTNRFDFRGALVLEASLEHNKRLSYLNVSGNPLSTLGFRSIFRLLARESSGIAYFDCEDCATGNSQQAALEEGGQVFSATNPTGRYRLDLRRPYHRALLKKLYSCTDRFGVHCADSFLALSSDFGYTHPPTQPNGVYDVPMSGNLSFTFSLEDSLEKMMNNMKSNGKDSKSKDFRVVLLRHLELARINIGHRKQVPVLAQWMHAEGRSTEQLTIIEALSKDFTITLPQYLSMCRSKSMINQLAVSLLPNLQGEEMTRYIALLKMPTLGEYLRYVKCARNLLLFNVENPTGHYKLQLGNCGDYSVAEQLALLNHWECRLADRSGLANVSQYGVRSCTRNEKFQDRPLEVKSFKEFILPEYGELIFDYVSFKKPPADAKALDKETFDQILLTIQSCECPRPQAVASVKCISHFWFLNSFQLRALTGIFKDPNVRADIFVNHALRVLDMHNEKIFRARFSDQQEFRNVMSRLGDAAFFPFMQPEETGFVFDFNIYDQRLACSMLVQTAMNETMRNLKDYKYTRADGTVDYLTAGVPMSWHKVEALEHDGGVFEVYYTCSADDRNFKFRKSLMEKYGNYTVESEKDIMYWSGISTCPEDVVEFVEFIVSRFKDLSKPFALIDGPDGNGEITLSEFSEGLLRTLKFKKFAGPDQDARIKNVFRFLDPGGEGSVSPGEWQVLGQLYREIDLCVKEFVEFCVRTFGPDLNDSWNALDASGDGEVDEEEWLAACESMGFFGPARPIFSFLDKSDDGSVGRDEFSVLEEYLK
eukprot:TRINITY_DN11386_c0_g2_i1.p1 TRINITY_DN11386_c0_g2~~TRINITY_DN11386_c0_g2_i1.p1  ORF type:complete len:1636 (-),score=323.46 TRINITY_DN11386_c0_g2_i1:170-5077(-)